MADERRKRAESQIPQRCWRVGDKVEVLWHGKPYDGTVREVNDTDGRVLVGYDPPFDRYEPEWR